MPKLENGKRIRHNFSVFLFLPLPHLQFAYAKSAPRQSAYPLGDKSICTKIFHFKQVIDFHACGEMYKRTETTPKVNQLCCLFRLFSFLCFFPRLLDLGFHSHRPPTTATLFLFLIPYAVCECVWYIYRVYIVCVYLIFMLKT